MKTVMERRTFFRIFSGNGLTKRWIGCILYDTGSVLGRCSPQDKESRRGIFVRGGLRDAEEKSKNLRESV
jgi:hypothetical protein